MWRCTPPQEKGRVMKLLSHSSKITYVFSISWCWPGTLQTSCLLCQLTCCKGLLIGNVSGRERLERKSGLVLSFLLPVASCGFPVCFGFPGASPHQQLVFGSSVVEPPGSSSWIQCEAFPNHRTSLSIPALVKGRYWRKPINVFLSVSTPFFHSKKSEGRTISWSED